MREGKEGYRVEVLGREHDRSEFDCGSKALNEYLMVQAGQDARKGASRSFVLCEGASKRVVGFYTLSALSMDIGAGPDNVVKKLPRYPGVPATLLGRLAIHNKLQGKGAGEHLLMDALHRSWEVSRQVASVAVVVDVKDDRAMSFYKKYDFTRFRDEPMKLFLPMNVIEKLFS